MQIIATAALLAKAVAVAERLLDLFSLMISIIIPVLNEGEQLHQYFQQLTPLRERGCELIGVDGGSTDNSFNILQQYCDVAVASHKGRSTQMNAGAKIAQGNLLLFLHADTHLPSNADALIKQALHENCWGRFNVKLDNPAPIYRLIALFMNARSRLSKIATGDQGIFFKADFFKRIGGYPEIPLMEDIAICKLARKQGKFIALQPKVITSARRWEKNGPLKTILLMWKLRFRYFLGASPKDLAQRYYG